MEIIPTEYDDLSTNYDWSMTLTMTGDYSAKNFFFDVTAGNGVKLFSATITLTYSAGDKETTIVIVITKAQIATLTVGNPYYADLKLDDGLETKWLKVVFNTDIGQTSSSL